MASRFTKPLRPAFLFRPRSDKGLSEAPEFILHNIPALSVEDATLTPAEYEQRQIAREEEGFTTGELDNFNRFCNVKRLHMHINKVNDLAGELEAWAQEMDVPLGTAFVAAHIKSFARPYYSDVNVKANMEVSKEIKLICSCGVLYCVVLWCVVSCCGVLCCAVLCCAVLCFIDRFVSFLYISFPCYTYTVTSIMSLPSPTTD